MAEQKIISTLHFPELPYYLTIKKETDLSTDMVTVWIESLIHVERIVKMPTQYSAGFVRDKPSEFERDILGYVIKAYGLKPQPLKYM